MKIPQGIKRNISLKNYSTFKIGDKARFFVEVKTLEHLISVLQWAKTNQCPFFILGNGSNVLFQDRGFNGLVIKLENSNCFLKNKNTLVAEAGLTVGEFLSQCIKHQIKGFEWLAGIPGTIGGAVYGNAGAFGYEIKNFIKKVITLDPKNFKIKKYSLKQCRFDYRESIFKKNKEIILSAELKLKKGKKKEIQKKIQENWQYKVSRHLFEYPSAGSVFKNIIIKDTIFKKYYNKKTEKVRIKDEEIAVKGGKVSAGYFIEKAGLKGYQIGGAKIADFHANVIINVKNARADDILHLIKLIKDKVWKKFKIKLQEEIIIT